MFKAAKLKIKRAEKHITELDGVFGAFFKKDCGRLVLESDAKSGEYEVNFLAARGLPDDVPNIIGDALHNLRSALDVMYCEIVTTAGGTITDYTKIPFRSKREEFVAALGGGEIKLAPPEVLTVLTDTVRPYKGGNDALYALHDANIVDKHITLMPTYSVVALHNARAVNRERNISITMTLTVEEGRKLKAVKTGGIPLEIADQGQPSFAVFFQAGKPFAGQAVIPTLQQLTQMVTGIVKAVEDAYPPAP